MLERRTNFNGADVRVLYDKFREFAENDKLDMHALYKLMTNVYPRATGSANVSMASLFDSFDTNLSGDLDIKVGHVSAAMPFRSCSRHRRLVRRQSTHTH